MRFWNRFEKFLRERDLILKHLGYLIGFVIAGLVLIIFWLRWYTDHGHTVELPNYIEMELDVAIRDAKRKSFRIQVSDSVFIVGKDGGIIIDQNPNPKSKVKERRKIYVTISKFESDKIPVRRLPVLYGKSFERKKRELKQGFEVNCIVEGYAYDSGEPDHILMVVYEDDTIISSRERKDHVLIEKGGTLKMTLSKKTGGTFDMPDLRCQSYLETVFLLQTLNLVLGREISDSETLEKDEAFVWNQNPSPDSRVTMGDTVIVYISDKKPSDCPDQF